MKKEVTDERHGNTFNKWIEKMSEFLEDSAKFTETKKKNGRFEYSSANNKKIRGIRGRCDAC